jgi:hypothetical protein
MDEIILNNLLAPLVNMNIPELDGLYLQDKTDPGYSMWDTGQRLYIDTKINEDNIKQYSQELMRVVNDKKYLYMYNYVDNDDIDHTIYVFQIDDKIINDIEKIKDTDYDKLSEDYMKMLGDYYELDAHDFINNIMKKRNAILEQNELKNKLAILEEKKMLLNNELAMKNKLIKYEIQRTKRISLTYVCKKYIMNYCSDKDCQDIHPIKSSFIRCKYVGKCEGNKCDFIEFYGKLVKFKGKWYLKITDDDYNKKLTDIELYNIGYISKNKNIYLEVNYNNICPCLKTTNKRKRTD